MTLESSAQGGSSAEFRANRASQIMGASVEMSSARLEKEIARGGMGAIYTATDPDLERVIAVKVALDESNPKKFFEEARVTAQLEHPNVVPIHDAGLLQDGRSFFSMKLVQGQELKEILQKRKRAQERDPRAALNRLLEIFLKVCDGIAYAHSKNVVHRDLKPENIMVGEYGEVLVMDWGISRVRGESMGESDTVPASDWITTMNDGEICGTPCYMAPEQAAGENSQIGPGTDIYGLGGLLYEILTGFPPIDTENSETLIKVLRKVIDNEVTKPELRAPRQFIPRELSAIAMKALSAEAHDRYATVAELQSDIRLYLTGHSVSAISDSYWQLLTKLLARKKKLVLTLFIFIVLLSSAIVFGMLKLLSEKDQALEAREQTQEELTRLREGERKTKDALAELEKTESQRLLSQSERIEFQKVSRALNEMTTRSFSVNCDRDGLVKEYDRLILDVRYGKTKRIVRQEKVRTLLRFQRLIAAAQIFNEIKAESPNAASTWDLELKLKLASLTELTPEFLAFLKRFQIRDPQSAAAYFLKAYELKDGPNQLSLLNQALAKDRSLSVASVLRASLRFKDKSSLEEVVQDCTETMIVSPSLMDAYLLRGKAFRSLRRFDEAFEDFERALLIADKAEARRELGALYMAARQPQLALPHFVKAVSLDPNDGSAHESLTRCAFLCGDPQRFIYFRNYQQRYPEDAARLKTELGIDREAASDEENYRRALEQARLERSRGRFPESLNYYRKAESIKARTIEVGLGVIDILIVTGRFKEAESIAKNLVASYPRRWEPRYYYLETLVNLQSFQRVLELFREAYSLAPTEQVKDELKCFKSSAFIGLKRYEDARKTLGTIAKTSKSLLVAQYLEGLIYCREKNFEKALPVLRQSWKKGYYLALYLTLQIFKDQKNKDAIQAELRQALGIYPQWRARIESEFGIVPK